MERKNFQDWLRVRAITEAALTQDQVNILLNLGLPEDQVQGMSDADAQMRINALTKPEMAKALQKLGHNARTLATLDDAHLKSLLSKPASLGQRAKGWAKGKFRDVLGSIAGKEKTDTIGSKKDAAESVAKRMITEFQLGGSRAEVSAVNLAKAIVLGQPNVLMGHDVEQILQHLWMPQGSGKKTEVLAKKYGLTNIRFPQQVVDMFIQSAGKNRAPIYDQNPANREGTIASDDYYPSLVKKVNDAPPQGHIDGYPAYISQDSGVRDTLKSTLTGVPITAKPTPTTTSGSSPMDNLINNLNLGKKRRREVKQALIALKNGHAPSTTDKMTLDAVNQLMSQLVNML